MKEGLNIEFKKAVNDLPKTIWETYSSFANTDDYELLKDMNIQDLSIDTIESYRRIFRTLKPDHYWNELSNEDFLIRIGALAKSKGEVYCTKAGLLMFGYDYNIIRVFPNYFMDYRENITELSRYDYRVETGDGNSEGNIFRFFTKTMNILNNSVNEPFRMQNSLYREGGFFRKNYY